MRKFTRILMAVVAILLSANVLWAQIKVEGPAFPVGDYTQELMLECNDPDTPEFIIDNTMHVYQPAQFAGYVYDNDNTGPLPGVTVTAGAFQTLTAEDGTYELYVDEGAYDVTFEKLGYQTYIEVDTFAAMGIVTPLDVGMWDMNYPPTFVYAEVMDNDTWCEVTWALPAGPYEIQYDDGTAEDLALWMLPGSQSAVKFTLSDYPCTVIGGRIYVGDGSFPAGNWLGSEFGIAIYDDDGTDGLPGTMLDSGGVTVNNFGWVDFDWFSASFTEGDFYISMIQVVPAPNAAPIGIDVDNPTYYRSYSNFQGQGWTLSPYQDFMIRAWVDGPEGDFVMTDGVEMKIPAKPVGFHQVAMSLTGIPPLTLPGVEKVGLYKAVEGVASRDVTGYGVVRYSDFDPNFPPELGTMTPLATTSNLYYNDMAWAGLVQGWYAYGVRAHYTSCEWSEYAVSNIVDHLMEAEITVNVTLSTGFEPVNVEIEMQGLEYPYQTYTDVTPSSGTVVFDPVWKGCYTVTAFKIGYELYRIDSICFYDNDIINIVLSEKKYPVTNLYVDPLTLIATWNEPLIIALDEDFEEELFPPPGWQMTTLQPPGWYRTNDGSGPYWQVPTWDGYYAVSNDDAFGSTGGSGAMDYLITPQLDLRESDGFAMCFDSYYDGTYGQLAFVEYSYDAGTTWEVLYQMPMSTSWTHEEIDLAAFSGPNAAAAIWLAFHSDDGGNWASGWCIDNVKVQVPDPAANYIDFHVFLDDDLVAATDTNIYNYVCLTYGVEYEASVAARYTSGLSDKDYYVFLCKWLIPPRNLVGAAPALLTWDPPLECDTLTLISEEPRQEFPNPVTEYSPMVRTIENNYTGIRDLWDLQFAFATADNSGEAGAETDGDYLYTTQWNGSGFHKYELDGTYVGPMSVAGIGSICDLAYDPGTGHMFGGAASTTVYEMDFATQTQIGTFNAPVAVRAIAYDPDWDGFWANNWSDNITLFDKTGTQLNSFPVGSYGNYYGFAHDEWSFNGPFLWGFSQDGGNTIVQIEIATGLETGFTYNVNSILFTGSGIAGGLFTHPNLVSGFVTIGGNSQNDTYFGYELWFYGPMPLQVPDNLLGYNIYCDEGFVLYQDHVGGTQAKPQSCTLEGLQPGIYTFSVTAVYDLTKYGFPGETGESMEEGPVMVTVDFCYDLEFMEDWTLGTFGANNWTAQSNWSINGQIGNPAPAAEFTWDPIQTEYELSLTSYPLCGTDMSIGTIWLDFDLKHESYNHTGEEYMLVQVWNWDNDDWFTVLTYSDLNGSFDWINAHKDIKAYAMGKIFKIRFLAQGMNSLNILSWFVDNIHVYRTCAAPTEVTAEEFGPDYDDILVSWTLPGGSLIDEWFHYDDGINFTAIGTGAAAEFDAAARWEPAQLVDYDGTAVTEIAFFPAEALCEYHVRVWVGAGAANMVVDQVIASPLIGQWNYIILDTPVPVDITQELWVGYYVNTQTGYPAGCDAGPAIDGFGNMMNLGGWQTLLQIDPDLDYNWNIQAHVLSVSGDVTQLSPVTVNSYENAEGLEFTLNANHISVQPVFAPPSGTRFIIGFNIFRNEDGGPYGWLAYVEGLGYIDEDLPPGIIYCYKITAIYTSDIDWCESDYSNEACAYVTVGVDEPGISSFVMYPNPAVDYVAIESSDVLKRVTVYNTLGQLIMDEIVSGNKHELKTASYTVGAYMVRIETEKGVSTSVLNVQR